MGLLSDCYLRREKIIVSNHLLDSIFFTVFHVVTSDFKQYSYIYYSWRETEAVSIIY